MNKDKVYSGNTILVLDDIQAIRKYPGMYIGSVSNANHLIYEILNNSVDEVMMGYCDYLHITAEEKNHIIIKDNGRGIPIDQHKLGVLTCELVINKIHSGGKFNEDVYQKSGGLHGVGLVAVNALTSMMKIRIQRNNQLCFMEYAYGKKITTNITQEQNQTTTGTEIEIIPDKEIFDTKDFDINDIFFRLKQISALNKNLTIIFVDKVNSQTAILKIKKGVKTLLQDLLEDSLLKNDVQIVDLEGEVEVEAFFNWEKNTKDEKSLSFTNCVLQPEGGAHVLGVRGGLIKFFSNIKEIKEILKDKPVFWTDIKAGFRLVIGISVQNPKFDSQSKTRLISNSIKKNVEEIVYNYMRQIYKNNESLLSPICSIIIKQILAKNLKNIGDNFLNQLLYNGRLVDCLSKDRKNTEVYIVEGESAGGVIKPVIDRNFQGVLSLRGKIINVEKANIKQILESEILNTIVTAIGGTYDNNGNVIIESYRFDKIIILVDADADGSHIRALLLTLFYKNMFSTISDKKLYIAKPPLFRIQIKDKSLYFNHNSELYQFVIDIMSKKYFNSYKFNEEEYEFLINILTLLDKYIDIDFLFSPLIISFCIQNNIKSYKKFCDYFALLEQIVKKYHSNWQCYVDNSQQIIIEDYIKCEKLVINESSFRVIYNKIISKCINYSAVLINLNFKAEYKYNNFFIVKIMNIKSKLYDDLMIQRFKGLGEMNPDQIYNTVIDKKNRILRQVTIQDAESTAKLYNTLMGHNVLLRKIFINKHFNSNDVSYE